MLGLTPGTKVRRAKSAVRKHLLAAGVLLSLILHAVSLVQ